MQAKDIIDWVRHRKSLSRDLDKCDKMCSLAPEACAQLGASRLSVVHGGPVLGGYDMVEYFKQPAGSRNATKGDAAFAFNLTSDDCNTGGGSAGHTSACVPRFTSTFHFATPANRDAFAADPWRYAPQYGGF